MYKNKVNPVILEYKVNYQNNSKTYLKETSMTSFAKLFILFSLINSNAYAEPNNSDAIEPVDGEATLYVYRTNIKGLLVQPMRRSYPDLILDGSSIGVLKYKNHRIIPIKAGKHHLKVTGLTEKAKWDQRDKELTFKVKPGETKYLKINIQYDIDQMNKLTTLNKRAVYITPVDADDAVYEIRDTKAAE